MLIKTDNIINYIEINEDNEFLTTCIDIEESKMLAVFTFTVDGDNRIYIDTIYGDFSFCDEQADAIWEILKNDEDEQEVTHRQTCELAIFTMEKAKRYIEQQSTMLQFKLDEIIKTKTYKQEDKLVIVDSIAELQNTLNVCDNIIELWQTKMDV